MSIFAVLIFLFAASSFTAATWTHFAGGNMAMAQVATLAVPTLFVTVIIISFRRQHLLIGVAAQVTAVAMGFLNFAFLAALACWPVLWIGHIASTAFDEALTTRVLFGGSLVVALYGLGNAARLRVTRYTVRLANLPAAWDGREVAVVSDIHIGTIRGPRFVRQIIGRLNELAPQAVFIVGDMFDGAKVDIAQSVEPWIPFRAPGGTYFVTGNHDEFGDPAPYLAALTRAGIRVLQNEKVIVGDLQIVGLNDSAAHRIATWREVLGRVQLNPDQASILLAHRPTHLDIAAQAGVSLQLSGHTHAGQFPLWTYLVRGIYGRFAYGLNRFGAMQVMTSSGAGSGGPPLRVGTRSEIVLLRLEAARPGGLPR